MTKKSKDKAIALLFVSIILTALNFLVGNPNPDNRQAITQSQGILP